MNSEKNQEQNLKTFSTKKQVLEEKVKKLSAEVRRLERHEVSFVIFKTGLQIVNMFTFLLK